MPRHVAIGAALIMACAVLNMGFIANHAEELWKGRLVWRSTSQDLIRPRVCVLVTGGNAVVLLAGLAETIEGDHAFSYGVFLADAFPLRLYQRLFPADTMLQSLFVSGNESAVQALLFSAGLKGCAYYFVVNSRVTFCAAGWATALVSALRGLGPSLLGAVSPAECPECIFIHNVHRKIFLGQLHHPTDACWAEWVRSVYGSCRMVQVGSAAVSGSGVQPCSELSPALESAGRLRIVKYAGPHCNRTRGHAISSLVVDIRGTPRPLPPV